jgi:hypothetical protein
MPQGRAGTCNGGLAVLPTTAQSSHPTEAEMRWLFVAFSNEAWSYQCEHDTDYVSI